MLSVAVFVAAFAFIIYVLFGYPLLLAVSSRRNRRPVYKQPLRLSVSVILPVRNGEQWIRQKLESILALNYPHELVEIIVVSDGSTDSTAEIAEKFAASGVRVLRTPPGGKAVALNVALLAASGEILFFTDVRQRLAPDSLDHLVANFADRKVGVVSGELIIVEGETLEQCSVGLYWKYEKWIRKSLSATDSILGATGSIYAMRRELAVPLPSGTLLDDVHQPLAAFFQGYRVILDPEAEAYDFPTSLDSEFRRKVRTQAGMYHILWHYPALLGLKNRMWIHFVSHKLGRLLMPFALIAVFIAAFGLPGFWAPVAVLTQMGFYTFAIVDRWVPEGILLKRATSPIRTFTVLMSAALFAPVAAMSSSERIWTQTKVSGASFATNSRTMTKE